MGACAARTCNSLCGRQRDGREGARQLLTALLSIIDAVLEHVAVRRVSVVPTADMRPLPGTRSRGAAAPSR
jgi:hypothetical protein